MDTTDYLTYMTSFKDIPPISLLALLFLTLMRIAPIISIVPFLGAKLPGGAKMGLALALVVILLPHIILTNTHVVAFDANYIGYMIKELFVGIILALFGALPFLILESAGNLIDFQRGASSLQITEPTMQTQTSSIGLFFNYVMILVFFQVGGPFLYLDSILQSYNIVPADQFINPSFFNSSLPIWQVVMGTLNKVTALSIQLAAPSLVSILMTEMFLGIANRLAPQVQIAFLGLSLKSFVGLALLCLGWFFILQQMGNQSLLWIKGMNSVLPSLRM